MPYRKLSKAFADVGLVLKATTSIKRACAKVGIKKVPGYSTASEDIIQFGTLPGISMLLYSV
ncbi:hypothetical protein D3C87_1538230 [compost metagenome]